MRWVAALTVLAIALSGCSAEDQPKTSGLSGTCGLRKVGKNLQEDRVPEEFFLEGVELARTQTFEGTFVATINAPYSVNEVYRRYPDQVKEAGWKIFTQETEGFEAEIYLSKGDVLAAIQIRTSTCEGKVVIYVSIVDDPGLLPSPSSTPSN